SPQRLKPTNPSAQKALTTAGHYKLTPRPATRVRPKALGAAGAKAQLFDGLDDDEPALSSGAFVPRKSIKKLVLKNLNSSQYSGSLRENEDFPQNGHSPVDGDLRGGLGGDLGGEAAPSLRGEDDPEVTQFYVNPIAKPTPQTQTRDLDLDQDQTRDRAGLGEDTISDMNLHRAPRGGLELSSEGVSASLGEESLQEDQEETPQPPHPAGLVLTRLGYYTIPSLEDLAELVDENGECVVDNFTVGRRGYGSVFFPGEVNLTGLNLDQVVHFRRKEVIVYPDDKNKPPEGEGLNRRAEVTLDGVWPVDKTSSSQILSPERLADMNYEGRLEKASRRQGARFLEYRPETGSWVFEVAHFSKYGLQDSDEDEEVAPKADPKKLKTLAPPPPQQAPPPPAQALASGLSELDSDMADITQSLAADGPLAGEEDGEMLPLEPPSPPGPELDGLSASSHIASSLGINPHALQVMKASLLVEDEDSDLFQDQVPPRAPPPPGEVLRGGSAPDPVQLGAAGPPPGAPPPRGTPPAFCSGPARACCCPPRPPDPAVRTLGARRGGPVPLEQSLTRGKEALLMDMGLFASRSFRVGWGPGWTLAHCGRSLSSPELRATPNFSFLPRPPRSRPLTESPFKVVLERLEVLEAPLEGEESLAVLQRPLEISLQHCAVSLPPGTRCPLVQPKPGGHALHEYARWASGEGAGRGDALLGHWAEVWTLCEALWGGAGPPGPCGPYGQQLECRRRLSAWLALAAERRVQQEVAAAGKERHTDAIFSFLTGNRVSEACRLAQREGEGPANQRPIRVQRAN
ncbi:nuclear pore complex protein Nup98-Nup96-like, partial [Menidia menidia]